METSKLNNIQRLLIWDVSSMKTSGESMATKIIGKINGRIEFLYRKNKFLNSSLRRLLCNALVQPHFDYACSAWYPNLTQNLNKKLQTTQNKCIRFCLQLGNRSHIGVTEFKQINWLPIRERFGQCIARLYLSSLTIIVQHTWMKCSPRISKIIIHETLH